MKNLADILSKVEHTISVREEVDKKTIGLIIDYLDARHTGDAKAGKKIRDTLKSKLGGRFTSVLMKHGDSDSKGYMNVRNAWAYELK